MTQQPDGAPLAIFLSPHFDDIALSCGGMAARLSRMGARCMGVTVCAAPSPQGELLTPFAQQLHQTWESASGTTMQAINDVRREEERQALRLLGLEPMWLHVPDAIYRHNPQGEYFYRSDEELFGKVAPEERRGLVPRIAQEVRRIARESGAKGHVRVFAPLAAGNHVDHQLVYWAARSLPPRYGVLFYEDYPYVAKEGVLEDRIGVIGEPALQLMQPRLVPIAEQIWVKIGAIARYKSQLGVLFGSSEAMPRYVRSYAQAVGNWGGAQYAERFWYMPPIYAIS